ncbi:MAG: sodium:solute symporter, partial [Ignavibacteriae bacterium]
NFDLHDKYNLWSGIIGGFFLALSYFGTDQSQVGRFLTGKNVKESRIGLLVNGVVKIPMQFGILLIGALLVALYAVVPSPIFFNDVVAKQVQASQPAQVQKLDQRWTEANTRLQSAAQRVLAEQPNVIPSEARKEQPNSRIAEQPNAEYREAQNEVNALRAEYRQLVKQQGITESSDTNYIFLHFVRTTLPPGLVGLLFAVVILASWGSISAALHSLATASYIDLRSSPSVASSKQQVSLGTGHLAPSTWNLSPVTWHLIWGVFCIVISMAATRMGSLIEAVNVLGSLFYGPILGIFLVAFYLKRAGGTAVFWGAVIAEAVVVGFWWFDVVSFLWLNVVGAVVVLFVALILSRHDSRRYTLPA